MINSHYYKIAFAGGGTGGHLSPGIAVAEECVYAANCEIEFLIIGKDVEKKMLSDKNFRYSKVHGAPLSRSFKGLAKFFVLNILGFFHSFFKFLNNRPDTLVCLGGYGAFSSAIAARLLRIPVFVLEQNSIPGKVNTYISKFAKKIYTQWEIDEKMLHKNAVQSVQGNPVRNKLFEYDQQEARKILGLKANKITLLVIGGSQGAVKINDFVMDNVETLRHYDVQVIMITGRKDFDRVNSALGTQPNFEIYEFTNQMGLILNASDFVISRAGATTIAELTALGKPMMLVPYPYAAGRHQHRNAEYVTKSGAAIMYEEDRLTKEVWELILDDILMDYRNLKEMTRNSSMIGRPFAGKSIAVEILNYVRESKKSTEPVASKAKLIKGKFVNPEDARNSECILLAPKPQESKRIDAA